MGLLDNAGKGSVQEAHKAMVDVVSRIDPLLRDTEMRLASILNGLLDRIDGAEITVTVKLKQPRARYANPPPEQDKVY